MDKIDNQLKKISEMMKPVFDAISPMQKSIEKINDSIQPILESLKPMQETIKKLGEIGNIVRLSIPQGLADALRDYDEKSKKIFDITAKYQWFYNRQILLDNDIDIENELLTTKSKRTFDKTMITVYGKVINKLFLAMTKIEKNKKVKKYLQETKNHYKSGLYYSSIVCCQPIIEHIITRLNENNRITGSKDIRNLIDKRFLTERQAFDMSNNKIYELFNTYYYCDDKVYNSKSDIPNRHFIAHGFGFDFVSQKGALNMILLLSILYEYADFLKL